MTKRELTIASGREIMSASEANQVDAKHFDGNAMEDGVHSSAAAECKRLIETDGTIGAKSDRKHKSRRCISIFEITVIHYH